MTHFGRRAVLATALAAGAALRSGPTAAQEPSLAALGAARNVIFGMAVTRDQMESAPVAAITVREAAMLVPGLELKWSTVHPEPDRFDFADADFIIDFARQHGQLARGHTLVWHEALPAWVADTRSSGAMMSVLSHHIQTLCGRYAGRLHSWDVVNEVINPYDNLPGSLRASPFLTLLGPGYIELAFRLAAAADPKALLTINEYDLEMDTPLHARRRTAMLALLTNLVQRGVPVHALGIQGHLAAGRDVFDPALFRRFIQSVAALGLQVFITELDVVDQALPADITSRDRLAAAAERDYLAAALAEPATRMVVTWGVSDRYNWVDSNPRTRRRDGTPSRPHLFDTALQPKPERSALADALRAAPNRPAA